MLVASKALGIGAASFASKSGTSFGDGDEVTEPVEVPRSDFEKRDGNMASKDIAESPTAIAGTPRKRQQTTVNSQQTLGSKFKSLSPKNNSSLLNIIPN